MRPRTFPLHADESEVVAKLERQAAGLRDAGLDARVQVVPSGTFGPAHVIAEAAERAGADLIVTGTRGHSPIAGLLLGSVVQRLLHIAPCPVLAVPAAPDRARGADAAAEAVATP
jgi:nucleotide-binding universal stress UspA family protein